MREMQQSCRKGNNPKTKQAVHKYKDYDEVSRRACNFNRQREMLKVRKSSKGTSTQKSDGRDVNNCAEGGMFSKKLDFI